MCRPNSQGGRRCPGNRGERRSAYQRGRYAAQQVEKERETSTEGVVDGIGSGFSDKVLTREDVDSMTPEQRSEILSTLRAEIPALKEDINSHIDDMITMDQKMRIEKIQKMNGSEGSSSKFDYPPTFFHLSNWNPSGDADAPGEYEEKIQKLGDKVQSAVMITEYEISDKYGLNGDYMSVDQIKSLVQDYDLMSNAMNKHNSYQKAISERDIYQDKIFQKDDVSQDEFENYLGDLHAMHPINVRDMLVEKTASFIENNPDVDNIYSHPDYQRESVEYIAMMNSIDDEDYLDMISDHDLDEARHKIYIRAFQQESGQEYDSLITPVKTSISANPEVIDKLNYASSLFPDTLTSNASARNFDMHFVMKRDFFRNGSLVSHRAYFKGFDRVKVPVKGKKVYSMTFGGGMSTVSQNSYHSEEKMAEKLASGEMSDSEYSDFMSHNFPRVTDENLSRVKEAIDKQNSPEFENGISYVVSAKGKKMKVDYETFEDALGDERIKITSKNNVVTGHDEKFMSRVVTDGSESTTVHELAHYMEADPQVNMACKEFLRRRTEGLNTTVYNKADSSNGWQDEITVEDSFYNSYIGKDYKGQHNTEVFSMGMEGLFAWKGSPSSDKHSGMREIHRYSKEGETDDGIKFSHSVSQPKVDDVEHRSLIMGILSSVRSDEDIKLEYEKNAG